MVNNIISMKITDKLFITSENYNDFLDVTECQDIDVSEGVEVIMPNCIKTDTIFIRQNSTLSLPICIKTGYISIKENSTLNLPLCKEIKDVCIKDNCYLFLPNCLNANNVHVKENASLSLPLCKEVKSIYIYENSTLNIPLCYEINNVYVYENSTLNIPSGNINSIYVHQNSILNLPSKNIKKLFLFDNASLSLPMCYSIDFISVHENTSLIIPQLDKNYISVIGDLFVIENEKIVGDITFYSGYILDSLKNGILIKKELNYKTLSELKMYAYSMQEY